MQVIPIKRIAIGLSLVFVCLAHTVLAQETPALTEPEIKADSAQERQENKTLPNDASLNQIIENAGEGIPPNNSASFEKTILKFDGASYSEKADVIESLSLLKDKRVLPLLVAMADGRLYMIYGKSESGSPIVVISEEHSDGNQAVNVVDESNLGLLDDYDNKKIRINNRLRRVLKPKIAISQLSSDDKFIRLQAAKKLREKPVDNLKPIINDAIAVEKNADIKNMLREAKAMIDINSDEEKLRLAALEVLGDSVEPEAVAVLTRLSERDENGTFIEENIQLAKAAELHLKHVESKLKAYKFGENLMFGLSLGSILLLAAIGLAITFGVMGVINMAHGEMIMLGAYTTFAVQQMLPNHIEVSLFIAIPAAFLVSGLAGVLIERLIIRHMYGRPLDTLLATFGVSLILQQAVRTYNSNNVPVETPRWLSGLWELNGAFALTYNRIYIILFSVLVLFVLALLLKKTMMGLQMRAVTQNRAMANSMGIRSGWVDALTFGLGSGIAGIAGVALSQITNVGPNLGQGYIIDSFMVVVFGGVGNLLGTFVGAMSLGVANKFLEPFAGAVVAKIMVLVFIILFTQWRPRGLFALKGRFVED